MNIDITQRLKTKMTFGPRTRGRYNSSELYGILNGYLTPEQWMGAQPEREVSELLAMWNGTGMHNQLAKLLGLEFSEHKRVFPYKGLNLVAKADFLPEHKPQEVWEFKTSKKIMDTAKPWHIHQVKLYTSMFDREIGLVYQPVEEENRLILKHLGSVERDDKWFEEQLEKLYEFHLKVEKLWEKK